jgi:Domain of unknown function (DUF3361)
VHIAYCAVSERLTTSSWAKQIRKVATTASTMDIHNPTQTPNVSELLKNLGSTDDPVRKMAAFKLQTLINDPSFAELFVSQGGLPKLRLLVLESTGNTLSYGLASFARLLDVDQGWDVVDTAVVEKVMSSTALRQNFS